MSREFNPVKHYSNQLLDRLSLVRSSLENVLQAIEENPNISKANELKPYFQKLSASIDNFEKSFISTLML